MTILARLKNDGWVKQRFIRENKKTVVPGWYPNLQAAMLSTLAFCSGFSVSRSPVSQGRPADWANMGAE